MSDHTKDPRKDNPFAGPLEGAQIRRPHATIDLKATEINVTSLSDRAENSQTINPRPAAASTYTASTRSGDAWDRVERDRIESDRIARDRVETNVNSIKHDADHRWTSSDSTLQGATRPTITPVNATAGAKPQVTTIQAKEYVKTSTTSSGQASVKAPATTATDRVNPVRTVTPPPAAAKEKVIVQKRGGFFSHTFAGLLGGALAFGASQFALPQLSQRVIAPGPAFDASPLEKRLFALEKQPTDQGLLDRIAELEKTAKAIPSLADGQTRFIAETKATLAASENSAGSLQQIERLDKIETQIKTLATEMATVKPSQGADQSAALETKISGLETNLATQIAALKKSVGDDLDTRIAAVRQINDASKAGSEQTSKEIADVKAEAQKVSEQYQTLKADYAKSADNLKLAQDEIANLTKALETVKASSVKTEDIATAVTPLTGRITDLDKSVQAVMKAESDRRSNAERVLLTLELQNLKRALDRGHGFGAELDSVQKAGGSKIDLAALTPFKEQGIPPVSELNRDFQSIAAAALNAEEPAPDGGVVDRLLAGAKSVIRVRKTDHQPDDKSPEAVVGRMELALRDSRLSDVLQEAKSLPQKAQDAVKPFLDRVAARESIETALVNLETQIKTSLGELPAAATQKTP